MAEEERARLRRKSKKLMGRCEKKIGCITLAVSSMLIYAPNFKKFIIVTFFLFYYRKTLNDFQGKVAVIYQMLFLLLYCILFSKSELD